MCFISLCMLRYSQYLLEQSLGKSVSATQIMEAIYDPLALVQGEYPNIVVTPTRVSQTYLDLASILKLPLPEDKHDTDQVPFMHKIGFNNKPEIIGQFKNAESLVSPGIQRFFGFYLLKSGNRTQKEKGVIGFEYRNFEPVKHVH